MGLVFHRTSGRMRIPANGPMPLPLAGHPLTGAFPPRTESGKLWPQDCRRFLSCRYRYFSFLNLSRTCRSVLFIPSSTRAPVILVKMVAFLWRGRSSSSITPRSTIIWRRNEFPHPSSGAGVACCQKGWKLETSCGKKSYIIRSIIIMIIMLVITI